MIFIGDIRKWTDGYCKGYNNSIIHYINNLFNDDTINILYYHKGIKKILVASGNGWKNGVEVDEKC